jgi:transcriptional regulator with XRE-family HTH domain
VEDRSAVNEHIGRRLRRRRRLLGLTQQELAKVCGLRFQQIQKYECGANALSAGRIWQLAQALECSVSYFFATGAETGALEPDAEQLLHNFERLDEEPRRRLLELAKALGGDDAG